MPRDSLPDVVLITVVCFLILSVGIFMVSTTAEHTIDNSDGERVQTAALLDGAGTWTKIGDTTGTNETVHNSRGYAVNLTGSDDSYVESDTDVDVATSDTWTVSVWAYVDGGAANDDMIAASVDGRAIIEYNGTADEWRGWYFDDGSGSSYEVNISTSGNEAGNYTNVMLWHNNGQLAIFRDNTSSNLVSTSGDGVVSAPFNATNWNGRLEELRTFDEALNNSERNTIMTEPLEPMPGSNPTARIMFDEPYRDWQYIFYSDANLDTSNVTFSDGFQGTEMQRGQYAFAGDDYDWNPDGPRIKPLGGGELEDAPVAYVDYNSSAIGPHSLTSQWESAVMLAALLPIILILGYTVARLRTVR